LGAEFLAKPIDLEDLEGMVNRLLAGDQPEASAEEAGSESASPSPPDTPPGDTI
jgi:hypothetical protein